MWLLRKKGFFALGYLDDFVGIENSLPRAAQAYEEFLSLTSRLGLALALDKCVPPTSSLVWLAFLIDAPNMSVTIPHEKLAEILEECKAWSSRKSATKKQLQIIAGKLQHIAKCVRPAKRFVNHVLAAVRASPPVGSHTFEVEVLQE